MVTLTAEVETNQSVSVFCVHEKKNVVKCFHLKECDQVHIEDVASDDNGQDLRCVFSTD